MDDSFAENIAGRLIARSLEEMRDPEKFARWENGDRAREEASNIVSAIVAEAVEELEQKEKQDAK